MKATLKLYDGTEVEITLTEEQVKSKKDVLVTGINKLLTKDYCPFKQKQYEALHNLHILRQQAWEVDGLPKYTGWAILFSYGEQEVERVNHIEPFLYFTSKDIADRFLELHYDLIMEARPILSCTI